MNNPETQDRLIDDYLKNNLDAETLKRFETEIEANEQLKDRIHLRKEMMNFFQRGGDDLFAKLQSTGDKYFENTTLEKPSNTNWTLASVVAIVAIAVLAYFLLPAKEKDSVINSTPINVSTPSIDKPILSQPNTVDSIETKQLLPVKNNEPSIERTPKPNKPRNKKTEVVLPAPPPIAAVDPSVFKKNSYLEDLRADQVRSSSLELDIETPRHGSKLYLSSVNKQGLLIAGKVNMPTILQYSIYDNQQGSFLNNETIDQGSITIPSSDEESTSYHFKKLLKVPFEAGRYYLILMDEESEDILDIQSFIID